MSLIEIKYFCKFDNSMQPAMFRKAEANGSRPLVVALHTWSYDHSSRYEEYCSAAEKRDWHLIFPKFRGPNILPEACGSDIVVSDLEDAVTYMKKVCDVDTDRIYLVGGSGGGHCSLLMAGRRPDLWTAVSSWCPLSDIAVWHAQCKGTKYSAYADHIEKVCGGDPAESEQAGFQCALRSPLTWLPNAAEAGVPVDISTGIHDGHTGSVPISQAFNAYNVLALESGKFSDEEIGFMVREEKIPAGLEYLDVDPAFGKDHPVLLRRQSANTRITIFEGSHNIFPEIAFEWFSRQSRSGKTDWSVGSAVEQGDGALSK